jgi:predicted nucleotidyltransferase
MPFGAVVQEGELSEAKARTAGVGPVVTEEDRAIATKRGTKSTYLRSKLESAFGQRIEYIADGASVFDVTFGETDLIHQLASGTSPTYQVKSRAGELLENRTLDNPDAVRTILASGESIVLNRVQDIPNISPALRFLLDQASEFSFPCIGSHGKCKPNTNAYLSGKGGTALAPHTDTTDTIIIQMQGSKAWRLCIDSSVRMEQNFSEADAAQLDEMRRHNTAGCSQIPRENFLHMPHCFSPQMRKGDILYIPKGVVHQAVASNETSVHLTIAFPREGTTWGDYLLWAVENSRLDFDCKRVLMLAAKKSMRNETGLFLHHQIRLWRPEELEWEYQRVRTFVQETMAHSHWSPHAQHCQDALMVSLGDYFSDGMFSRTPFTRSVGNMLNPDHCYGKKLDVSNMQSKWKIEVERITSKLKDHAGDSIHSVYVRGSVAQGTARDFFSDIDLIILTKNPSDNQETFLFLMGGLAPFVRNLDLEVKPYLSQNRREAVYLKMYAICLGGSDLTQYVEPVIYCDLVSEGQHMQARLKSQSFRHLLQNMNSNDTDKVSAEAICHVIFYHTTWTGTFV